jgi:hypothetical protein
MVPVADTEDVRDLMHQHTHLSVCGQPAVDDDLRGVVVVAAVG